MTGESSAINGQIFIRGIPEDYDDWAARRNDEWNFGKLVPYFNMVETDTTYQDDPGDFHGSNGPIICHRFPQEDWRQGNKVWFKAWRDAGHPYCEDHNAPGTTGVGPIALNNPNGIRWSTAIGYLGLSRHRLNLTIRADVTVKRLLFDTTGERPKATGVDAVSGDESFVVEADKIILSAGAIGSPQILMLSGVGPADHLKEHGIETVSDSPGVGKNLADHPLINILWATKPDVEMARYLPSAQLLLRYTAGGFPLENDMIVCPPAVGRFVERPRSQRTAVGRIHQVQQMGERHSVQSPDVRHTEGSDETDRGKYGAVDQQGSRGPQDPCQRSNSDVAYRGESDAQHPGTHGTPPFLVGHKLLH